MDTAKRQPQDDMWDESPRPAPQRPTGKQLQSDEHVDRMSIDYPQQRENAENEMVIEDAMTNYNERLDKILERYRLHADMAYSEVEDGFHTADEFKDVALPKVLDEAKQAITSLIKEMVAEAKPMVTSVNVIETYLQNGMTQKAAEHHGRNHAIDQFEQNLLKELEEV